MIRNYLKFAWRHLRRSIGYSFINTVGLAVGIASILLIVLYIQHEMSFDEYHEQKEDIYRVTAYSGFNEKSWQSYVSGDPIPEMRQNFTGVQDGVRMKHCSGGNIEVDGQKYSNVDIFCTESNLFNIFSFPLLQKSTQDVLGAPFTAVISQSTAQRVFGGEDPIGKSISFNWEGGMKEFEVTGVMEDIPVNTHFRYDVFLSYKSLENTRRCPDCGMSMYVLLDEEADTASINDQILQHIREIDGKSYVEDIRLQPLDEVHFSSLSSQRKGDWQYIQILSAIALVILLIACGNYLNLATARYASRAKEIGIRKVLGAYRSQLTRQLLFETMLLALIALPIALMLVKLAIPWFNTYAGTEVSLALGSNLWFYPAVIAVLLLTGLLAGSYPALYISSFQPRQILQGKQRLGAGATGLRKGLVTFQFLASIVMIAITLVIVQQLDYVMQKNLGFDSDQLVSIRVNDPQLSQQGDVVRQQFLQLASVKAIAKSAAPATGRFSGSSFVFPSDSIPDKKYTFSMPRIDEHFLETMDIELLVGRNLRPKAPNDSSRITEALINETGVKTLGFTRNENIIDRVVADRYLIVGVTEDFHLESLQNEIEPAILGFSRFNNTYVVTARLAGGNIAEGLQDMRAVWEDELGAENAFDYTFVDDQIQQQYEQEQNTAKVIGIFAGLSIFIASMGLFGLAAFTTQQRYQEIGIRKVLGASISNIIFLLYKDFGKLIVLASITAIPVIYYAGNQWLENFAYSIELSPVIFGLAILGVLLITLVATGSRSLKAALMNPVDAIRQE